MSSRVHGRASVRTSQSPAASFDSHSESHQGSHADAVKREAESNFLGEKKKKRIRRWLLSAPFCGTLCSRVVMISCSPQLHLFTLPSLVLLTAQQTLQVFFPQATLCSPLAAAAFWRSLHVWLLQFI